MTIITIISALLIYLFIGYLLSIAFQEDGQHSISSVLLYPVTLVFLFILTIILLIFDGFSDSESEYMAQ